MYQQHKLTFNNQLPPKLEQEAQLSPRDRATRHVSINHAKCRTDVRRIAFDKSCIRRMTSKVTANGTN